MITDKEYPATHSMSTSWYMVDDEGNIGIMQFDDNGPVPYGLESDCSFANDAATGEQLGTNGQCGSIRFTEQQIDELLGPPHAPQEEKRWWNVAVKIAPDDEARFHLLADNSDIDVWCMSEQSGLYMLDASECVIDYERVAEGTVLDVLIKQGIIRAVYTIPELEMDCKWDDKLQDVVFTKNFDSAPYYIYLQPYWPDVLQKRMCTPHFPVTIDQVAEEKRHKLLRIPGKFSEMDRMQIAQWHACRVSGVGEYRYVGDDTYNLLPTPDGEARYFLNDVWDFDFFPFCPPVRAPRERMRTVQLPLRLHLLPNGCDHPHGAPRGRPAHRPPLARRQRAARMAEGPHGRVLLCADDSPPQPQGPLQNAGGRDERADGGTPAGTAAQHAPMVRQGGEADQPSSNRADGPGESRVRTSLPHAGT